MRTAIVLTLAFALMAGFVAFELPASPVDTVDASHGACSAAETNLGGQCVTRCTVYAFGFAVCFYHI